MMTLDECIAAARLPIRVTYRPGMIARWRIDHRVTMYVTTDIDTCRSQYVALRTRLSEQQGEKR